MKNSKKYLLIIFFYLSTFVSVKAQVLDTLKTEQQDFELESILEETIQDAEDTQINEYLEEILNNPIDINFAAIDDLTRIPLISFDLALSIIKFREKYGYFLTLNELINVPGMNSELLSKIKPFFKIDRKNIPFSTFQDDIKKNDNFFNKFNVQIRQRTINNFQTKRGYTTGYYYNSPLKIYNRAIISYSNKTSLSILTEKDPGEKSITDFYSLSLLINDIGFLKKLVIGDYVMEFGQGLAMWRQIGFAKGSDAVYPIKKKGKGIVQYKSTDENQFFRGIAAELKFYRFELSGFISSNYFDARIDTSTNVITSTPLDGYHRNENELMKKNSSNEFLTGVRLNYKFSNNQIGITHYRTKFKNHISPNSYFKNYSDKFYFWAVDYNIFYDNLNFFGEFSRDKNNVFAIISGIGVNISSQLSFTSLFRNYPARYINIHGYGFGERNGQTNNETGFYLGIQYKVPFGKFDLYFDQFKFNYPLYNNKTLTNGKEFLLNFESKVIKHSKIIFKYKNEIKEINSSGLDDFGRTKKISNQRLQQNIRIEVQRFFSSNTRVAIRTEIVNVQYKMPYKSEYGYLIFGDLNTSLRKDLIFKLRTTFYQTSSYDTRLYQLESDVPGVFYSSGLYGKGLRWYGMLRYKLFSFIDISLKYSELIRDDVKKIGTGYDEIPSNLLSSITLQVEIKF